MKEAKKGKEQTYVLSSFEISKLYCLDVSKVIIYEYIDLINFS